VAVLSSVLIAQENVRPPAGPPAFEPRPSMGPDRPVRERAQELRARAREARELAERLSREADELDRMTQQPFGPERGPEGMDRAHRELAEIKEAIGRAEREGRWEEAAELRRNAERLIGQFRPPERGPQMGGPEEAKERIERLRDEARRAKEQGRFEEAERLWNEAQGLEMKMGHEYEIRRISEQVEARRDKAAALREQAERAEREGRLDEARMQRQKAENIEREAEEGIRKAERVKAEARLKEFGGPPMEPGPRPQDGELMRVVEELKREVKRLRQEMNELRGRMGDRPV
jgi:tetratricopeptide (TPR) repeat protein